ncbi:MAG: hypothetical protein Edafosvirus13_17 [Edafosvirus sp.]|uniref:Uncharacterized protein n=1 Tax=Edafosvirus sp. TaxID=2487765 RepID=A0A3G4ZU75_9VIRU|nr:MAG: hypothetical protein Edafosvirus13_17 [Edafosvirus sp.]
MQTQKIFKMNQKKILKKICKKVGQLQNIYLMVILTMKITNCKKMIK